MCGCEDLLEEYHMANPVPLFVEQTATNISSSREHEPSSQPKAKRKRSSATPTKQEEEEELFVVSEVLGVTQGVYHYFVHWKGYSVKDDSWVPLNRFRDTSGIEGFHTRAMLEWDFPKRGEVSVLVGGPPCQGMSVINRFRNFANPLDDKKNGMLVVFLDYVRYFHPEIVLFENVPGIFSLSDGYLLRFLIASFISMGYQVKQAVLQAAFYGVPQRRWRVIIWAAQKGVRMPHFPSPTHCGEIQVPHIIGRQYNPFAFPSLCAHVIQASFHASLSPQIAHVSTGQRPAPPSFLPRRYFRPACSQHGKERPRLSDALHFTPAERVSRVCPLSSMHKWTAVRQ